MTRFLAAFCLLIASGAAAQCRDLASSDPIWQAINAQYGRIAQAQRAKDIDTLAAIYASDFQVVGPNDAHLNREQSLNYSRAAFRLVKQELHTSNTILNLQLCGDRATTTVLQQWSRIQEVAGKPRRFDTAAVQDETWIRTNDGWKRWRIANVRPGAWFVDDKRVDTHTPYDPDAPEYDPYDAHPKQSIADALEKSIEQHGLENAKAAFESLRKSGGYYVSERALNALGYRYLKSKNFAAAIFTLKLNTELFAGSANVWDSLAEAYMRSGDRQQAIENYRKSLTLNPENTNATEQLKALEAH